MMQAEQAPGQETAVVFSARHLMKSREKGGVRFELRIPALDARAGEFLAVVGASGCGKSTLLDMLGLVLRPDAAQRFALAPRPKNKPWGWVDLRGKPEQALARFRKQEIGYVLQSGGLLPYLSVRDNILLPCLLNDYSPEASLKRTYALAEQLGIAEHFAKKPAHLSGGQRQRVAIARALVHSPLVVLADEPTAAVDSITALDIRDAFRAIAAEQGVALIMVTHDHELIRGCADRIVTFQVEKQSASHIVSTLVEASDGKHP